MRYERKFPTQYLSPSTLGQLIWAHPAGFRKAYPNRQVNSIYFDTPDWRTFYDNLAGISERKKYRLRWYGRAAPVIKKARFEIKRKENLLGTKIIYPIPGKISWESVSNLPALLPALQANALFPTLVSNYQRTYYASADGCFRLTVDQQLRCGSFDTYLVPKRSFPQELCVVELKYAQKDDDRLDEFTQYWPLRWSRFSKYVLGMQMVYG